MSEVAAQPNILYHHDGITHGERLMVTKQGTNRNDNLRGTASDDILYGLRGNDTIDGGRGNDDIVAGDGNDKIIGHFDGSDAIDGGSGTDTLDYSRVKMSDGGTGFDIAGSARVGTIFKGAGEVDAYHNIDIFVGTRFADTSDLIGSGTSVFGGDGADNLWTHGGVVRGDAGTDILRGDTGYHDTFWLQRGKGADTVNDFSPGEDTIRLSGDEFALGPLVGFSEFVFHSTSHEAEGNRAQLIFQTNTGELYYDSDGIGAKGAELIATLTSTPAPYWSDFEIV